MTTARFYLYNDARLLMLRARRRGFLRQVRVGVLAVSAVASIAFLSGYLGG